ALVARRMDVVGSVGMPMVVPVLGGPPQYAALRRALRERSEHELGDAAGRVGAVREVSMISGPDGEDSQPIKPDADRNRLPGDPGPDGANAGEVHEHERYCGRIDDVVLLTIGFAYGIVLVIGHWLNLVRGTLRIWSVPSVLSTGAEVCGRGGR